MQTITRDYKVFEFSELSEEAKEKVIQDNYDININYEWWEFVIEGVKERLLKNYGLEFDKVFFDLEYRYRHLYFNKIWIENIKQFIKGFKRDNKIKDVNFSYKINKAINQDEITFNFENSYYGGGDGKTILSYNDYTQNAVTDKYKFLENLQEWFNEEIVDKMLSELTQEYDYLTSKEAIIESIEANDFKFLENGEFFN